MKKKQKQKKTVETMIQDAIKRIDNHRDYRMAVILEISRLINKKYRWKDRASQDYLDDAGIDADKAHIILLDLFTAKHLTEWANMFKMLDELDKSQKQTSTGQGPDEIWERLYQQALEIIQKGDYKDIRESVLANAQMALTYRCYEPWETIVKNAGVITSVLQPDHKTDWGKIINYLYDGYGVEA